MIDVVTVPDFAGPLRELFEWRTLFFLASWQRQGMSRQRMGMHLVCIGKPPESVHRLAVKLGVNISVHAPALGHRNWNVLRAFDTATESGWILLLDTDVVFVGELFEMESLIRDEVIYIAPAGRQRFDEQVWEDIYAELAIPLPADCIKTLDTTTETPRLVRNKGTRSYPFYNPGVMLIPKRHAIQLRDVWAEHNVRILALSRKHENENFKSKIGNMEGLATAMEVMKSNGVGYRALPDRYHGRWRHLYLGSPRLAEMAIYHGTGMFRRYKGGGFSKKHVWYYQQGLLRRFWLECKRRGRVRDIYDVWPDAYRDSCKLRTYLCELYRDIENTAP